VAYVMDTEFGFHLPKAMHIEFGKIIKNLADASGTELTSAQLFSAFEQHYLQRNIPLALDAFHTETSVVHAGIKSFECVSYVSSNGNTRELRARGNGPIDAFVRALNQGGVADFKVLSYNEHALGQGADAQAVAYIQIQTGPDTTFFGAAVDTSIELASVKAVLSALNRSLQQLDRQPAVHVLA
jgi:2-isopropylmalate synthase